MVFPTNSVRTHCHSSSSYPLCFFPNLAKPQLAQFNLYDCKMRPPCVFCEDGAERAGKLLKCLHKVCNDCLPASVQEDGRIRCAKCRRPTPCPPPARSHEQFLVDDTMFNRAKDYAEPKRSVASHHDPRPSTVTNRNPVDIRQESSSSLDVHAHAHAMDAQGMQNKILEHGRFHHCPVHGNMEMRYYCHKCREVLCETCKLQSEHASHTDQIRDVSAEAAALRHRLTKRLKNISPESKKEEVEAGMKHAGDLIEAFGGDLQGKVADIKRSIHEHFDEQLQRIKQQKEEMRNDVESHSKTLREAQVQTFPEYNGALVKAEGLKATTKAALRNEDLLKMRPRLTEDLASAFQHLADENYSQMRRVTFECQSLSDLGEDIGVMGYIVDNTDIDLFKCAFADTNQAHLTYVGEETEITATVNNWQGKPVSESALKACSIQIWATRRQVPDRPVPVFVPISGCSKGRVHAVFHNDTPVSEDSVFVLELRLDSPDVLPGLERASVQTESSRNNPLRAEVLVFKSRAIVFDHSNSYPKGFIKTSLGYTVHREAYPHSILCHMRHGIATIRAIGPIQERDFSVVIEIVHCASSKLDIGFTWDSGQKIKRVLASSGKQKSFGTPICGCCSGDLINVSRSDESLNTYSVKHIVSNMVIKQHSLCIDTISEPFLMVQMFHSGTKIKIYNE